LKISTFLENYYQDPLVQTLANELLASPTSAYWLKGLKGSMDAVIAGAVTKLVATSQLYILEDKSKPPIFKTTYKV